MLSKQQGKFHLLTLISCIWSSFASDQIRLVGSGSTQCSGRVEVQYNGSWGTVCDDYWDLNDAKVVCRQLSCGTALQATQSAHFGQGSDPIWLDDVACSGSESSLTSCSHIGVGTHNCNHSEDAGVICSDSLVKPYISMDPAGEVDWGREVRITCSTEAELLGQTFFLQKISDSFRQTQDSSSRTATFTIPKMNLDHEGSYQCQYEKTVADQTFTSPFSDSLNVTVTVTLQKPHISLATPGAELIQGPGEVEVTWGHSFTLTCSIMPESPQGHFFLLFSGYIISSSTPTVNYSASFYFSEATFEQQGNYSCVYQVASSSRTFISPESAHITVGVKQSVLKLTLLSLGGVFLLLLFILFPVCLVRRRRELRHPMVLLQIQRTTRKSGKGKMDEKEESSGDDNHYENVTTHLHQPDDDDNDDDDYVVAIFDKSVDCGEPGLGPRLECVSAKSKSPEDKMDEEYEEISYDSQQLGGKHFESEENIYQNL